ncbi:MAG: type II toxin-antitoxin system RelE/ParE family toxin [Chloroflexi bacterium]|nr:type II toxin-antitoxin system RelE/ParE family toxin [Chloroflexota bacterium]MBM3154130.1 type II toxin-antitoxin system RelE/ParE family toxin [Chloroflexota bacterium]MBM4450851.1 type II toxin-antitoxin system RelE/ParE family toxin [Chloroflexota bacterium]
MKLSPHPVAKRILGKIEQLESNPRPSGCKMIHGHLNLWRIRVGEYRVIYSIDDRNLVVDVSVVRHRGEAYR